MKAIKSVSKLEDRVSQALWRKGIRIRRNVRSLFGNPDFAMKKYKIVIFIDSCFWHACKVHGNRPKTNTDFWNNKLDRNIKRDNEVNKFYYDNNWRILRVWEHELKEDFNGTVNKIYKFIEDSKRDF